MANFAGNLPRGSFIFTEGSARAAPNRMHERRPCGPLTTQQFSALVQSYQSLVYTVCLQLVGDESEAQDLAQETFLAAWRAAGRCPPGHEKQWLARIAANKAKDYLRSGWARKISTPGDDELAAYAAPPGQGPEQQALARLGEREITELILALREPYKTPCRLILIERHTAAEAAAICGRPQKTVEAQLARGRRMLAQQIEQSGKDESKDERRRTGSGTV